MNQRLPRWAALDDELTGWARALVGPVAARWAAGLLAHSGDSQWWLAAGALLWWRAEDGWREAGMRIVTVTLISGLTSTILKWLVRRPRPGQSTLLLYLPFDRHSFPSGHATRIGGLIVVLGALAPAWAGLALVLWGLAVGVSRVALGVHFAADIAAGWLLGVLLGFALVASGL